MAQLAQVAFLLLALLHLAKADYDYNYDEYDDESPPLYENTSCNNCPDQPPELTPVKTQFLVEPLTLTVNEGDMIRLPCMVDRFDQFPLLMWLKDSSVFAVGEKILFDNRFRLVRVNKGVDLVLGQAKLGDGGEYTCRIASGTPKDLVHSVKVRATSMTGGLAPLLALLACDCLSLAIAMTTG